MGIDELNKLTNGSVVEIVKESNDRYMRKLTDAELEVQRLKKKINMNMSSSSDIDELKSKLLIASKIIAKLIK